MSEAAKGARRLSGAGSVGPTRAETAPGNLLDSAWDALGNVYDPELCLDVVSLGLVYDVRNEDGTVVVEMTLTTPGCPASESLPEMARAAIEEVVGSDAGVDIRVVWDPPWSPAMMNADAAGVLGLRSR